jgi:uncharacterized protein
MNISIERELTPSGGRYVARVEGLAGEAELVFSRKSAILLSADHTGAPDSLRGTGAARALVERLIADARTEGFKIIPVCPYVKTQVERHPAWADVIEETR